MPINEVLATAIKKAKSAPMNFAFIAKGSEGSLLVDRKIPPNDVSAAKKELGGGSVIWGRCFGEDGQMIFEVGKEQPAALAAQIRRVITKDAGLTLAVEVRFNAAVGGEPADGDGQSAAPAAAPAAKDGAPAAAAPAAAAPAAAPAAPAPAAATDGAQAAAAFAARLKPVLPLYQKALQSPDAARVEQLKGVFNAVQTGVKAQHFDEANAQLKNLLHLLTDKPAAAAVPAAPPAPPGGEGEAFKNRLKQILPLYEKAKGAVGGLPALMAGAMKAAQEGHYAAGLTSLGQIVEAIKAGSTVPKPPVEGPPPVKEPTAEQPKATPPTGSLVKYRQALLRWDGARKTATAALKELKDAILADFPDGAGEVAKLDSVFAEFNGELKDKIDAAMSATDEKKRLALTREALGIVRAYSAYVSTDERIQAIDDDGENDFATAKVGEPLLEALSDLESYLSA